MTLDHLIYVRCDGCGRPCGHYGDMQDNAKDARRHARSYGWKSALNEDTGKRYDYCPQCQGGGGDNQP